MTLHIVSYNKDHTIIASDRRVSKNGVTLQDEFNKINLFNLVGTRFAAVFTGSAYIKGDTTEWIRLSIIECARPDFMFNKMLDRFADKLSETLNSQEGKEKLCVYFCGFVPNLPNAPAVIMPFNAYVSNFDMEPKARGIHPPQKVIFLPKGAPDEFGSVDLIGAHSLVDEEEYYELLKLVDRRPAAPSKAFRDKSVAVITRSARKAAGTGVGQRVSTVIIHRDPSQGHDVELEYFSEDNCSFEKHYPPLTNISPSGVSGIPAMTLTPLGPNDLTQIVPKAAHDQAFCLCGSGNRFKDCHKLIREGKLPKAYPLSDGGPTKSD